jgi:hypothetical protein
MASTSIDRGRLVRLLLFAVVGIGAALWYSSRPEAPATVPRAPSNMPVRTAPTSAGTAGAAGRLPDPVALSVLEQPVQEQPVGRNPFLFGERPAPPPPPRSTTPPAPMAAVAPQPQGPPPIALKLVGIIELPGSRGRMVTFRDPANGAVLQGFEGDVLDGRYRVVRVGVQSAVVSYVDGTGTRTIPLGG